MKKLLTVMTLLILTSAIFAVKFDPDWFQSRTIIGCFTKDAIPNMDGKLDYTIIDGVVHTGLDSFDELAKRYQIVDIAQAHPYVKDPTWNDKGMYLQHVYRFFLSSDDFIDDAVESLANDPALHYAELEAINRQKFVPNDPMLSSQYAHDVIRSFEAWDYTMGSHNVLVSITDSGVRWNHPDLRANIWINPAEAPGMSIDWDNGLIIGGDNQDAGEGGNKRDDLVGWDFYDNDNNPIQNYANNDHGTHVAGCAGAVGNNGIGVVGTSPIVSILSCKGAPSNSPSTGIAYGYDQIKYSAEIGAHIINASWGGPGSGTYPNQIVNYATNMGALVVTAAGNDDTEHNSSYQDWPADCPNALTVAATGADDTKTYFSDYGNPIDVCAPGQGILSTIVRNFGYDSYNGTSMASPIVAGVAALVKSMHPELTPIQLKERIILTVDPIDDINPSYAGLLGTGRINAYTATMYDKIPYVIMDDISVQEEVGDGDGIPNPGETVTLSLTLSNPMTGLGIFWANGENVRGTLRTSHPGVTIIDSVSTFGYNGTLFAGSTEINNSLYRFSTVATLPSEPIPFEMIVQCNDSSDYPLNKSFPFEVTLPLNQQGWPYELGGAALNSPILVDLTGDGKKEIVFGDLSGKVNAVKYRNNGQVAGFPVNLGSNVVGSIAMGTAANGSNPFFAATLNNNKCAAFSHDGQVLFSQSLNANIRGGSIIAKLKANEADKVVCLTQNGNIHAFNQDGSYVNGFPTQITGTFLGSVSAADLNGDGNMEILALSLTGMLYAIDVNTAQNIAGFPVQLSAGSQNPIITYDLNGDGKPEILVTTGTTGKLIAVKYDGSIYFEQTLGGQIKTNAVIADVNDDGNKEIIVITANGNLHILNLNGQSLPNMPISIGANVEAAPVVAKFDPNTNNSGIIFGDTNGYLHSVRIDGTESPNFPMKLGTNIKVSAALADIDGDGDLDIVLPDNENYQIVDIKRGIKGIQWACFMGSYNRAGYVDQTTSTEDVVNEIPQTALIGAYPNPFNPTTTISFNLEQAGKVELVVYNQKGQKVRSLVNAELAQGKHNFIWDGTDDKGQSVSSGMYLYRMKSGKYSSTKKMILMK